MFAANVALPSSMRGAVTSEEIMRRIHHSKQAGGKTGQPLARFAEFHAHLQLADEQEKAKIAREIHHDMGGNLAAIKMALSRVAKRIPPEQGELRAQIAYVNSLVDQTFDLTQQISGELRPPILDAGIVAALEWAAKDFSARFGRPCEFAAPVEEPVLSDAQTIVVFRVVQESLSNVAKHAAASRVIVRLFTDAQALVLEVADNGGGLIPGSPGIDQLFGIRSMVIRAQALGGEFAITDRAQGGTLVQLRIPLPAHRH